MNFYDTLYLTSTPLTVPYFLWKYISRGKYHRSLPAMLGKRLPEAKDLKAPEASTGPVIWVHAVSVGEVVAARSVIAEIRRSTPGARILVSTITETGQGIARATLAEEAEQIFFYPLDLSWNVERFLDTYRPDALIMMETELWPNMLTLAGRRGVKIFMINARLSGHSFDSYRRFHFLFRKPLSNLTACAAQTQIDAERLRALCGASTEIAVTGNCKFDTPHEEMGPSDKAALREKFLLSDDRMVIVAGCTHPGEEDLVLKAWREAQRRFERATLVLCPRHPERFAEAAETVARHNLTLSRVSKPDKRDPQVLLLDEMGALARVYGIADIAIVCGTFVPIGGHSLLEPAVHAVPIVYGPHMFKQKEMLRLLGGDNGGIQIPPERLTATLSDLLGDPDERARRGRMVKQAVDANRGSARRSVEVILPHLATPPA